MVVVNSTVKVKIICNGQGCGWRLGLLIEVKVDGSCQGYW